MDCKYYVIGGQYEATCYGASATLAGAKRIARKHPELWDNWRGWRIPNIYRAEDVRTIEARGLICTPDGWQITIPRADALPYAVAEYRNGRAYWYNLD